jgi:hypothetical protein
MNDPNEAKQIAPTTRTGTPAADPFENVEHLSYLLWNGQRQ